MRGVTHTCLPEVGAGELPAEHKHRAETGSQEDTSQMRILTNVLFSMRYSKICLPGKTQFFGSFTKQ